MDEDLDYVTGKSVTAVEIGGRECKIYTNTSSLASDMAAKQLFVHPPLTMLRENGQLKSTVDGDLVIYYIRIFDDQLKQAALEKVKLTHGYDSIHLSQIYRLPIQKMKVIFKTNFGEGVKFLTTEFSSSFDNFPIQFKVKPADLEAFQHQMKYANYVVEVYRTGARSTSNVFRLTGQHLLDAGFFTKLTDKNNGAESVDIHTDDLRNLLAKVVDNFQSTTIQEFDGAMGDDERGLLLSKALSFFENKQKMVTVELENLPNSTFNKDNLSPDVLEKDLNELFQSVDNKDLFKLDESTRKKVASEQTHDLDQSSSLSGKLKIGFGMFSGSGSFSSASRDVSHNHQKDDLDEGRTFSKEEITKRLSDHHIISEWKGTRIIPKKVILTQINKSNISAKTEITSMNIKLSRDKLVEAIPLCNHIIESSHTASPLFLETLSKAIRELQLKKADNDRVTALETQLGARFSALETSVSHLTSSLSTVSQQLAALTTCVTTLTTRVTAVETTANNLGPRTDALEARPNPITFEGPYHVGPHWIIQEEGTHNYNAFVIRDVLNPGDNRIAAFPGISKNF